MGWGYALPSAGPAPGGIAAFSQTVQKKWGWSLVTEAERICVGLGGPLRDQAVELAENVLFMSRKLRETRQQAAGMALTVEYDNGGGQSGTRENPVFKAYVSLNRQYVNDLRELASMLDRTVELQDEEADPLAALMDEMRNG